MKKSLKAIGFLLMLVGAGIIALVLTPLTKTLPVPVFPIVGGIAIVAGLIVMLNGVSMRPSTTAVGIGIVQHTYVAHSELDSVEARLRVIDEQLREFEGIYQVPSTRNVTAGDLIPVSFDPALPEKYAAMSPHQREGIADQWLQTSMKLYPAPPERHEETQRIHERFRAGL